MDQDDSGGRAERFAEYLADLASVLGDGRRQGPMVSYCTGLLMPADRKSVEPMAALTAPTRTAAQHQSMLLPGRRRGGGPGARPHQWISGQQSDGDRRRHRSHHGALNLRVSPGSSCCRAIIPPSAA